MKQKISILLLLFAIGSCVFIFSLFSNCQADDGGIDAESRSAGYVDERTCYNCHEQAYKDWKNSHHDLAMQEANYNSVLGNFNNTVFESDGEVSRFFRKEGKYYVNTEGPDGKPADFQIKYTFGVFPLQQYIVEFPGGKHQCLLTAWDSEKKKWFDLQPGQRFKPDDWMHWTKGSMNWNTMCSDCHSTYVRKNYDNDTKTFNTKFSHIDVSCQACHGPGKKHNEYIDSRAYKKGKKVKGSFMHLTIQELGKKQIEGCARCHAYRSQITDVYNHQGHLLDHYVPEVPRSGLYQADGQILGEVFDYGSFLQSKMYRNHIFCTQCHNPHSLKRKAEGNALCNTCHDAKKYDTIAHHFHKPIKDGEKCVSCHMAGRYYMGNDFRNDHSFRVPRPDLSIKFGTTNACNICHTDKSAAWSADAVRKWYGPKRQEHYSDALAAVQSGQLQSVPDLVKMMGDTSKPEIIQATIVNLLGGIPSPLSRQTILNGLKNANPLIRYNAVNSMATFTAQDRLQYLQGLLADSVRAIRAHTAFMLADIPEGSIPNNLRKALKTANEDFQRVLRLQHDFPTGQLLKGQYHLKKRDIAAAEAAFKEALQQDPYLAQGHLMLANLNYEAGKFEEAEKGFKRVIDLEPTFGDAYFWLGLLQAEIKNLPEAAKNLEKAASITGNARHYYNWGLVLQNLGKSGEAEKVYQSALKLHPDSEENLYALAILYAQMQKVIESRKVCTQLLELNPENPEYLNLYTQLSVK
jgi:tetratricopeptide (TPR) repeat protein